MKKILCILIAALMLIASTACAETVFSFANPVLTLNMGQTQAIDLTGLELVFGAGEVDGIPAIQIDINGDGSKLAGINVNIVGDKVVFGIEGVSTTFYTNLPEAATNVTNLDLSGLNIDAEQLANILMSSIEVDGDTIKIPYTAVNDVLEAIAPSLEGVEIPGLDISQMKDAIAQLKQTNSGVNLEVTYTEDGGATFFAANVIPVQNGQAGETVLNVSFKMDASIVDFRLDAPGQVSLYFIASPVDENSKSVSLGGESNGTGFDLTGVASTREADMTFVALDAEGAVDIQSLTEEQTEAMSGELMNALGGLIGYIYGALGAAA